MYEDTVVTPAVKPVNTAQSVATRRFLVKSLRDLCDRYIEMLDAVDPAASTKTEQKEDIQ